ncbi:MAG TPA: Lrp/AsnC family transcriptional regulator, partial [Desulfuromonadales bacterium]|nr:Lrp/AsnC family transcriptional regulator [Desulfuromonadales bacterium]
YEVRLNPRAFGQRLAAFVFVQADRAANGRLAQDLAAIAAVQEVHQVAGDDGYLVKVRVADTEELGQLLRDEVMALAGVRGTRTQVVLSTVKETRRIALDTPEDHQDS